MNIWFQSGLDFSNIDPSLLSKWQYIGTDGLIPFNTTKNVGVGPFTSEPTSKFMVIDTDGAAPTSENCELAYGVSQFQSQFFNNPTTETSGIIQQLQTITLSILSQAIAAGVVVSQANGVTISAQDQVTSNLATMWARLNELYLAYLDQATSRTIEQTLDTNGFTREIVSATEIGIETFNETRWRIVMTDIASTSNSIRNQTYQAVESAAVDNLANLLAQLIVQPTTSQFVNLDTGNNTLTGIQLSGTNGLFGSDDNAGLLLEFTTDLSTSTVQMSLTDTVNDLDLKVTASAAGGMVIQWTQPVGGAAHVITLDATGITFSIAGAPVQTIKANGIINAVLPQYADDAAAGGAGLVAGDLYQTTGAGAAPLNVAGIVMAKQ